MLELELLLGAACHVLQSMMRFLPPVRSQQCSSCQQAAQCLQHKMRMYFCCARRPTLLFQVSHSVALQYHLHHMPTVMACSKEYAMRQCL